jgi:hypothetical protein
MKKTLSALVLACLMVVFLAGAETPAAKKISFSLGVSGLVVTPDTGDARGLIGPAAAVQFNLGKSLFVAPELVAGIGGAYGGATVNVRLRKVFLGAGGGLLYFFSERQEIQGDGMLKVQLGTQGAAWFFSTAYVSNVLSGAWLNGAQVTVGYVF